MQGYPPQQQGYPPQQQGYPPQQQDYPPQQQGYPPQQQTYPPQQQGYPPQQQGYPPIPAHGQVGIESLRGDTAPYSGNLNKDNNNAPPPMDQDPQNNYGSQNYGSQNGPVAVFFLCFLSFSLWMLMLAAHLAMTCACGLADKWLMSLVPIFLGPLIGTLIIMLILFFVAKLLNISEGDGVLGCTIGGGIWFFCVILACGLPYAQTCGQFHAAQNILVPKMQKTIHCWQNPNDLFGPGDVNFITLGESAWVVDYANSWKQKVVTKSGTEEDEDAASRYNFCIAPLTYRGQAPGCTYTFYASCYRQTTNIGITACTEADAIGCGWNFPANTVTMRTYNVNEAFYNNAETDENDQIMTARSFVPTPVGKQSPIVVSYADDGPKGPEAHKNAAQASIDIQATLFYVLFAVSMAVHSFMLSRALR